MSECVVRMEMPDWCPCVLAEDNNGWYGPCFAYNGIPERDKEFYQCVENMKRPSWCPILCQLPEGHGRLVDKDEMLKKIENYHRYMTIGRESDPRCIIEDSNTIVPAEIVPVIPDPLPIRGVEYVPTEVDVQTGTVTYELRERSEHS